MLFQDYHSHSDQLLTRDVLSNGVLGSPTEARTEEAAAKSSQDPGKSDNRDNQGGRIPITGQSGLHADKDNQPESGQPFQTLEETDAADMSTGHSGRSPNGEYAQSMTEGSDHSPHTPVQTRAAGTAAEARASAGSEMQGELVHSQEHQNEEQGGACCTGIASPALGSHSKRPTSALKCQVHCSGLI